MNNVFVYCEIEGTQVQEVSQELLTKGRKLANELNVELHAIVPEYLLFRNIQIHYSSLNQ